MSTILSMTPGTRMLSQRTKSKMDSSLKPFGFCCSMDRFDFLTRYDQRIPPYVSSLSAITSVNECPVSKMQVKFFTSRPSQKKRKLIKSKEAGDHERSKAAGSSYFHDIGKNGLPIRWYLEDEVALAKDILWAERQRIYNEESDRAMKNLINLENIMRADYEETKTDATQAALIAIGIISTFFKLKPNIIKKLHKSCNLNSVDFLQAIYRILTKSDFYEEEHKKFYDCNERIILSAIAFLTLPETIVELHRRLPAVIMPRLPPKPKLTHVTRQKDICPYKEELFKRPDWAGYRNELQKWQKKCKLFAVPKMMLPFREYGQLDFINNQILPSEIRKQGEDIYTKSDFKETSTNELYKVSSAKYDQKVLMNIDEEVRYKDKDPSREKYLEEKRSKIFDISLDVEKKFSSSIERLLKQIGKSKTTEYKIYGVPKPPGADRKSWLGEKDPQYMIGGVAVKDSDRPVTYEIEGVANVTPDNSNEKFFAVLKLDTGKTFPSGRENLSRKWQEWLQNADEEFDQMEDKADELIKSVQDTVKLAFPEPVCDSCCPCRQTRRIEEKLKRDEIPYDNIMPNGEKNKYIAESSTMQPSKSNPTRLPIDPTDTRNGIKTNIVVDRVIKENGQIRYHVTDIHEEKVYVPTRIPEPPAPEPVKNVPPCECAIQRMASKDISSSVSEDDIRRTKGEGLCPGKEYRSNGLGAYSCTTYPDDKSCRLNPFVREITKRRRREGKDEKEEIQFIEATEKEIEIPKKKVTEKRKDKFIPDPDYPAYDDPWNITRTAPSPKIVETDYERTLKLTAPALSATTSPFRSRERQKGGAYSLNKEMTKAERNPLNRESIEEIFRKTFTNPSKETESANASGKISMSTVADKTHSRQTRSSAKRSVKHFGNVNRLLRHGSVKRARKEDVAYKAKQLDNRKQEMAKLKNMFKSLEGVLNDIQPAILPWELPAITDAVEKSEEIVDSNAALADEAESRVGRGPCGWRTKSEQELPAKKTLVYLCEPDYPLETAAVRPGERSCRCRENRSKKKILAYNVAGLSELKRNVGVPRRAKLRNEDRIIDGVCYFTPPVSPRRSDEYIPEYDLLESPYDRCVGNAADERLKLIERSFVPKNLINKIRRRIQGCSCSVAKKIDLNENVKIHEETRQRLMESKSPEERWKIALKDPALIDYFTQREDNAPCWTSCKKFARSGRPRRLKVVKPVCECKYERKIVERNEERAKWKARQRKLKLLKKQPFKHIVDISRPMMKENRCIVSGVKRIPRADEYIDDVKYCVSGVKENIIMSSPRQIIDGLRMSTPLQTPEPSERDILQPVARHRHWSPINVPPGPLPKRDAVLKEEMERRKKTRDEAFKLIYGDKIERDPSYQTYNDYQESRDEERFAKKIDKTHEAEGSRVNAEKEMSGAKVDISQQSMKKTSGKVRRRKDASSKEMIGEILHEKGKYFEKATGEADYQQDTSYKKMIDKTGEKTDEGRYRMNDDNDKKHINSKLMTIIKAELGKMAAEGYTFAKLPECYLMPQFKDWIMRRKGVAYSERDKKNLMHATATIWELMEARSMPMIETPSLHMTQPQLRNLTYDRAEEMQKKVDYQLQFIFNS